MLKQKNNHKKVTKTVKKLSASVAQIVFQTFHFNLPQESSDFINSSIPAVDRIKLII